MHPSKLKFKDLVYISLILIATIAIIFSEIVIYTARVEPKVTTEVYFTNMGEINRHIIRGEPFYVNFIIVNKDNIISKYRYVIFANLYNDSNSLIDTLIIGGGSVDVGSKGKEMISKQVNISENYTDCLAKISVEVYKLGSNQIFEIHYWATVVGEEK